MKPAAIALIAAICAAPVCAAPTFAQEAPAAAPTESAAPADSAAPAACVPAEVPAAWSPGPKPDKPVPPKCLNLEKNTTTCSKQVFDGYNASIAAYNKEVRARIDGFNAYGDKLRDYINAANDYASCENKKSRAFVPFRE